MCSSTTSRRPLPDAGSGSGPTILRSRCRPKRGPFPGIRCPGGGSTQRLGHAEGNDGARGGRKGGNEPDGGGDPQRVGYDPGQHGTSGVPEVPPKAIDADGRGTPRGVGDIADRREQRSLIKH